MDQSLIPIKNLLDAFKIRKIRNECRAFMTQDQSEIGLLRQVKWYFMTYLTDIDMSCLIFKKEGQAIGFGLIRKKDRKYWVTGGLSHSARGKGYGKELFKILIENVPSDEIWLEVLDSNIAAKKIYSDLGFKKINEKSQGKRRIIIMKMDKSRNEKI